MSAPWTEQEDEILREARRLRLPIARVLARLPGRSVRAVRNRADRLGVRVSS